MLKQVRQALRDHKQAHPSWQSTPVFHAIASRPWSASGGTRAANRHATATTAPCKRNCRSARRYSTRVFRRRRPCGSHRPKAHCPASPMRDRSLRGPDEIGHLPFVHSRSRYVPDPTRHPRERGSRRANSSDHNIKLSPHPPHQVMPVSCAATILTVCKAFAHIHPQPRLPRQLVKIARGSGSIV
jgi:hypothetical protein